MRDGIKELYKKYEIYLFPFLLTLALTTSIFDAYAAPFFSEWTLYQVLIIAGSYILFAFMRRHRFIGAVLYTVIGIFCLTQLFRLVFTGDYGSGFSQWFLSGASEVPTERRYYYDTCWCCWRPQGCWPPADGRSGRPRSGRTLRWSAAWSGSSRR